MSTAPKSPAACPHTDFTIETQSLRDGFDSAYVACQCGLRGKAFKYEAGYTFARVTAEEDALKWWEENLIDHPESLADKLRAAGWKDDGSIGPFIWSRNGEDYYTLEQAAGDQASATPAPESPAPAREPLCCPHGVGEPVCCDCHPEMRYKAPEVGTGSETSPEPAARELACSSCGVVGTMDDLFQTEYHSPKCSMRARLGGQAPETSPDAGASREAAPNVPLAKNLMRYDEGWRLVSLMVDYLETDRFMGVSVPETSLGWLAAAKTWLAQAPTRNAGEAQP